MEHKVPKNKKSAADQVSQLEMDDILSDMPVDFDPSYAELPPVAEPAPEPPKAAAPAQPSCQQLSLEQSPKASAASILFGTALPPSSSHISVAPAAVPAPPPAPTAIFASAPPFSGVLGGATLGNRSILVVTPRTNTDVTGIVENLQNGEACIITLDGMTTSDAQRRLDFLSGVVSAIGGTIRPLDTAKYILTPNGLGVRS